MDRQKREENKNEKEESNDGKTIRLSVLAHYEQWTLCNTQQQIDWTLPVIGHIGIAKRVAK